VFCRFECIWQRKTELSNKKDFTIHVSFLVLLGALPIDPSRGLSHYCPFLCFFPFLNVQSSRTVWLDTNQYVGVM